MSVIIQGDQVRAISLGEGPVSKASGTLDESSAATLFTVAGGEVLITSLYLKVTTGITVANTVTLQANPTTGDTSPIASGDLGTTDTAVGTIVAWDADSETFRRNGLPITAVVSTGTVELASSGTSVDGAVTAYCTWVPLTSGATLVAA